MSYEKVKSISFKDNKVFLNSACNNVRPLSYERFECVSLSKILKEKGRQETDIEILKAYLSGEFQKVGTENKYTKAQDIIYYIFKEEYEKNFSYDGLKRTGDYTKAKESQEYKDFLLKALNYKIEKKKYIIRSVLTDGYLKKVSTRRGFFTMYEEEAKRYDFKQKAEEVKNMFGGKVLEVKEVLK